MAASARKVCAVEAVGQGVGVGAVPRCGPLRPVHPGTQGQLCGGWVQQQCRKRGAVSLSLENAEDPPAYTLVALGSLAGGDTFSVITLWAYVLLPRSRSLEAPRKVVWSQAPTAWGGDTGVVQRTRGTCGDSPTFRMPARGCGPTSGSTGVGVPAFRRPADCNIASRTIQAPCTMTSQAAAASP